MKKNAVSVSRVNFLAIFWDHLGSILKKHQGERIAPYIFKLRNTQTIKEYLDQEQITYEVYQEERSEKALKRTLTEHSQEPRKKRKIDE